MIVKDFKHEGHGVHTLPHYLKQIEASTVAHYLVSRGYGGMTRAASRLGWSRGSRLGLGLGLGSVSGLG